MLGLLTVLAVLLLIVGWEDRHESGILPFVMGIVLAVFTLASLAGSLRGSLTR